MDQSSQVFGRAKGRRFFGDSMLYEVGQVQINTLSGYICKQEAGRAGLLLSTMAQLLSCCSSSMDMWGGLASRPGKTKGSS